MIVIDYDKCCWKDGKCVSSCCGDGTKCEGCVEACPAEALERKNSLVFYADKCVDCGACIEACKHDALTSSESLVCTVWGFVFASVPKFMLEGVPARFMCQVPLLVENS